MNPVTLCWDSAAGAAAQSRPLQFKIVASIRKQSDGRGREKVPLNFADETLFPLPCFSFTGLMSDGASTINVQM